VQEEEEEEEENWVTGADVMRETHSSEEHEDSRQNQMSYLDMLTNRICVYRLWIQELCVVFM